MSGVRVAIVAGETSGDRLAAGLISAIKARAPGSEFVGVGGAKMQAAGCRLLYDMGGIGVIGLDGLLRQLPKILRIRRRLGGAIQRSDKPDVFVGVDAPDFNLGLARKLRRRGVLMRALRQPDGVGVARLSHPQNPPRRRPHARLVSV